MGWHPAMLAVDMSCGGYASHYAGRLGLLPPQVVAAVLRLVEAAHARTEGLPSRRRAVAVAAEKSALWASPEWAALVAAWDATQALEDAAAERLDERTRREAAEDWRRLHDGDHHEESPDGMGWR